MQKDGTRHYFFVPFIYTIYRSFDFKPRPQYLQVNLTPATKKPYAGLRIR